MGEALFTVTNNQPSSTRAGPDLSSQRPPRSSPVTATKNQSPTPSRVMYLSLSLRFASLGYMFMWLSYTAFGLIQVPMSLAKYPEKSESSPRKYHK